MNVDVTLVAANSRLAAHVSALRLEAAGSLGVASGRGWDSLDESSAVLLAVVDGVPVGTMSIAMFGTAESLQTLFLDGNPLPKDIRNWPACALRRAATATGSRGLHVNSVLRLACLRALAQTPIRYVFGSVLAAATSHRFFTDLGYEVFPEPLGWLSGHASTCTLLLDMHARGPHAIGVLEARLARHGLRMVFTDLDLRATQLRAI